MTTEKMVATGGGPMIGVARRQKPRKPTARLVAQLERELVEERNLRDEARLERNLASNQRDVARRELARKSEAHMQALNQRDEAMNERDSANRESANLRRQLVLEGMKHDRTEYGLRGDLRRIGDAFVELTSNYAELYELNQRTFDKGVRNADVAAVLAKVIVAETDEGPVATMKRFVTSAHQMGVPPDVIVEVKNALTRGFSAQVEQAPLIVSKELLAEATIELNRKQALVDIRDDVLDEFDDYMRTNRPVC